MRSLLLASLEARGRGRLVWQPAPPRGRWRSLRRRLQVVLRAPVVEAAQHVNTMAAWRDTCWIAIEDLNGAMHITAYAFEVPEEQQDREELKMIARDLGEANGGDPTAQHIKDYIKGLIEALSHKGILPPNEAYEDMFNVLEKTAKDRYTTP